MQNMTPLDSLVNTAQLIEFLKDPEFAARIPELVEAKETIAQAETMRHEMAEFSADRVAFATKEQDLASREAELQLAIEANTTETAAIAEGRYELKRIEDALVAEREVLTEQTEAMQAKEANLAVATAKAVALQVQAKDSLKASNELIAEYKAKLETLSKL